MLKIPEEAAITTLRSILHPEAVVEDALSYRGEVYEIVVRLGERKVLIALNNTESLVIEEVS